MSVKTHPTAEEVYQEVSKILPNISLGTVYRNLEKFVAEGRAISLVGNVKRFDADISKHHHFICSSCGKVFDVYDKFDLSIKKLKLKEIGQVDGFDINFYGLCSDCKSRHRKKLKI